MARFSRPGQCSVSPLDHRNQIGEHHLGESGADHGAPATTGLRRCSIGRRSRSRHGNHAARREDGGAFTRFDRVEIVHDDDHRLGLSRRDQVIHDGVHMPLDVPARFILAPAVQQIKYRIPAAQYSSRSPEACIRTSDAIGPSLLRNIVADLHGRAGHLSPGNKPRPRPVRGSQCRCSASRLRRKSSSMGRQRWLRRYEPCNSEIRQPAAL